MGYLSDYLSGLNGLDAYPETFISDVETHYNSDVNGYVASVAEKDVEISNLRNQVEFLKQMNDRLLASLPVANEASSSENDPERDPDDYDPNITFEDLYKTS